ncbi:MAG: transketolase [Candidatus Nomurabacteria bacterium]
METITDKNIKELQVKANDIRKSILEMLYLAGSGHTAGSLGMTDIFTYLYFNALKHKPKDPFWVERDRLVLSNGHICPVLYATMAHAGYFDKSELKTLRKFGSHLQGHPHREFLPMLETSSGPLGEGLSQSVGMAIISKMDNGIDKKIYCLSGDGELNEGQNWEAIMLAAKHKLNNLILIVDRNFIQINGSTEIVMPLGDLLSKFKSFEWNGEQIDGNDFVQINRAIYNAKNEKDKPYVIIAKTIPCKGIKEWEGNYKWHGKAPNKEEYEMAMKELEVLGDNIK